MNGVDILQINSIQPTTLMSHMLIKNEMEKEVCACAHILNTRDVFNVAKCQI